MRPARYRALVQQVDQSTRAQNDRSDCYRSRRAFGFDHFLAQSRQAGVAGERKEQETVMAIAAQLASFPITKPQPARKPQKRPSRSRP
jgi:hypothetical protein